MVIKTLLEEISNDGLSATLNFQDDTIDLSTKNYAFNELGSLINLLQEIQGRLEQ